MPEKEIRRVCLYGGPGSGKSTASAWLYSELKRSGKDVELIREYVKNWAYEKITPSDFDPIYIFGKQSYAEGRLLRRGVKLLVVECPLHLCAFYAKIGRMPGAKHLASLAEEFDEKYPAAHIFLDRGNIPYDDKGRYQDEKAAAKIDADMSQFLLKHHVNLISIPSLDQQAILEFVSGKIAC